MSSDSDQVQSLEGGIARLRFERDHAARERDQALLALDEANRRCTDLTVHTCRAQGALVGVIIPDDRGELADPDASRRAARAALFDYIEVFSNRQRLHSGIDYARPASRAV